MNVRQGGPLAAEFAGPRWMASRFGDVLRPGLAAAKNALTSGSRDDRTNGTDMEMKPLGDFVGGYRFVEVSATDLVVTLGGEVRLLEQTREFWGTSHRN